MVSRQDVEAAYRFIMGREPDTEAAIEGHMKAHDSVEALRRTFFRSKEFRTRVIPGIPEVGKPLDWPPIMVKTEVTPAQLREMVARVETNFRHMGENEPHWSVLTAERYKAENISQTEAEFFASGREDVDKLQITAARCGVDLQRLKNVLELGCGVGRSTIWLAKVFPQVLAADVSAPHLLLATKAAATYERTNIQFLHVDTIARLSEMPAFDAFFSIIVFQHNPPPLICHMLRTVLGKLNPGGIAYFQIPTYTLGYSFDPEAYLSVPAVLGVPEMHVVPQPVLLGLVAEAGCRVLEMREDGATGGPFISNRLLLQKVSRA
jgi:SAM-dependent methyltransferase